MSTDTEEDGRRRHQQFIDDIADRVEEKLVSRFTKFLLLNAAAMIGLMATGIAAYYALDNRISTSEARIAINDARIERLINEDIGLRDTCARNQQDIARTIDQIRQLFYEHDSNLNRRNNR